jgi:hypothetical protein
VNRRSISRVVALAGALCATSACRSSGPAGRAADAPVLRTPSDRVDPQLLSELTVLATGTLPTPEELAAARATPSVGEYIDRLVRDPRMGREVVARFTFRELLVTPGFATTIQFYALKQASSGDATVNFLRKPCAVSQAVKVRPWWDLEREILVCPDSYQPDHWVRGAASRRYATTDLMQHCNSFAGSPLAEVAPYCGCGPNLIRCYRDEEHRKQIVASMTDELVQTVGHIVDDDLPIAELFTSKSTFHDRNVAFVYRQWRMEDEQRVDLEALRSLDDWPEHGKWAERPEWSAGQHAGVITAPRLLHENSDRRQRMREIYDKLWCSKPNSIGATAQQFLALKAKSLQLKQEGWQALASRELCTDCHARLDYSWQFMLGWGDGRVVANHFVSKLQPQGGVGPLYAKNIRDQRGEGPLNTHTFATLAVEQPEFRECMIGNVARHVFGDHASSEDFAALQSAFARRGTFKNLMRKALARYASEWREPPAAPPASDGAAAATTASGKAWDQAADAAIVLAPRLRAAVDEQCAYCHEPFEAKALPRSLVVRMLDQVAWGRMPKGKDLLPASRYTMVTSFIDTLWRDREERRIALEHFLARGTAVPVHAPAFARNIVDSLAGGAAAEKGTDPTWTLMEEGLGSDELTFTPGFAAFVGMEALERCKKAGHQAAALESCVERATNPALHSKVPIRAP